MKAYACNLTRVRSPIKVCSFLSPTVLHGSGRSGECWEGWRIGSPVLPSAYFPPALMRRSWPVSPLSWPSPVNQYLIPPHAPYLWRVATGSSQEVLINAAAGIFCQDLDPVSAPSPLRWHQYHLSSRFQLRNSAHRTSGHFPPQSPDKWFPSSFPERPSLSTPGILGRRKGCVLGTRAGPVSPR